MWQLMIIESAYFKYIYIYQYIINRYQKNGLKLLENKIGQCVKFSF
ncbi:hypothetical protein l11_07520 [Neisseria weaveri LMG 5135]|nr:hypothetical protein l11_07520 [Neisseria weaveri LMG 5135]